MNEKPAQMTAVGVSLPDLKAGIRRILTYAKPIASLTPTPVDDAAIRLLELLLGDDEKLAAVTTR